jgi:hypothetical protein
MRLNWALKQAQLQEQDMDYDFDDSSNSSNDDNDDNDDDAKLQQFFLEALISHHHRLRYKWNFSRRVVPMLVDHSIRMRFQWALNEAAMQQQGFDDDDEDIFNDHYVHEQLQLQLDDDDEDDDDDDDDDDGVDDDPAPTPTTTRPRQQRAGNSSEATTGGATVWVDGLRRSARLQPILGSLYENGRRRSARFL